jgi:hypothetical protein
MLSTILSLLTIILSLTLMFRGSKYNVKTTATIFVITILAAGGSLFAFLFKCDLILTFIWSIITVLWIYNYKIFKEHHNL